MKKIFSFSVLFVLLTFSVNYSFADCSTGFACSIKELELKENMHNLENIIIINSFFNKKLIEPSLSKNKTKIVNYNDLFIYKTVV